MRTYIPDLSLIIGSGLQSQSQSISLQLLFQHLYEILHFLRSLRHRMSIENKPIQSQNKCISDSSILDKYELKLVYFVCHDIRG